MTGAPTSLQSLLRKLTAFTMWHSPMPRYWLRASPCRPIITPLSQPFRWCQWGRAWTPSMLNRQTYESMMQDATHSQLPRDKQECRLAARRGHLDV